jgi:hypothetical protein
LTGAATFSFKQLLGYPHEAEWTPFQTHYFSENLVMPGIEPGTLGTVVRNSDHRGGQLHILPFVKYIYAYNVQYIR